MAQEIETKVLEVDLEEIRKKLESLGAQKTEDTTLIVDWFNPVGVPKEKSPWFLRVRSYSSGKVEVTWKPKSEIIGLARKHKEVNVIVDNHEAMKDLFEEIGLEVYAHQEKKRVSYRLGDTSFDLDTYPKMKTYLEIEGSSEESIKNSIKMLGLESNETWNDGERTLIENKYGLNWADMRF